MGPDGPAVDTVDLRHAETDNSDMPEFTPDAISHRLAEILDELAALPDGPSSERFELLSERDSLRSRAADLHVATDDGRSVESLNAELASLKSQRKALAKDRGGYITGDSADSAGRVGVSLTRLRSQSAETSQIERLTVRMSHIEDVLKAKRGDG
jgi:hypothetical protein